MTDTRQNPEEFLPSRPPYSISCWSWRMEINMAISIMLEVEANTRGQVLMGPGTLCMARSNA